MKKNNEYFNQKSSSEKKDKGWRRIIWNIGFGTGTEQLQIFFIFIVTIYSIDSKHFIFGDHRGSRAFRCHAEEFGSKT